MKKLIWIIFLLSCSVVYLSAQISQAIEFDNINGDGDIINCFFQDKKGIIWIGSGGGLYTYNGVSMQKKGLQTPIQLINQMVHCMLEIDELNYYIGTSNGLGLLNIETDMYQLCYGTEGLDIRSLARLNDREILLGTMSGLFRYDLYAHTRESVQPLASYPVYSIIVRDEDTFFISGYQGFYLYEPEKDQYTFIPLPGTEGDPSLVISMIWDHEGKDIWVGTERGLLKYHIEKHLFEPGSYLSGNSIKTMRMAADGILWVGTDNGLYVYSPSTGRYKYLAHSPRDSRSLINNTIWGVFEDRGNNMWLGTDRGISLYRHTTSFRVYQWESIVKSDEGNRLECIFRDSRNNIWLGGSNGLAVYNPATHQSAWYKMTGSKYSISHNRIRTIYEDRDGDLWVTNDGSISRFDYHTRRFINYIIMDSTQTRNANWAYNIVDDDNGSLWISSYLGGVFVVNKKNLLARSESRYLAEKNYFMNPGRNGLISNCVQLSAMDRNGNLWVHGKGLGGLNKIDVENNRVIHFSQGLADSELPEYKIAYIMAGEDGYIWVGTWGAMVRIDPLTDEFTVFEDEYLSEKGIYHMAEEKERIWLIVSDGICAFNKKDQTFQYMLLERAPYSVGYWDPYDQQMWIGGEDHFLSFSPEHYLNYEENEFVLLLTDLYVNEKRVTAGEKTDGSIILDRDILFTDEITLKHHQNHISFQFTDVKYSRSIKPHYLYYLEGVDKIWRELDFHPNRISYSNLIPGKYRLFIKQVKGDDLDVTPELILSVRVLAPWYASWMAKCMYALLLGTLFLWILNYFRVRNRLKIERIEREKTLELSNMKMEFLSNISHELKTPLSLILNPVNKIVAETRNASLKEQLKLVQQNAARLNTLVHQIIHYKDKEHTLSELKFSRLEFVEFIHSILHMHAEVFSSKQIRLDFTPCQERVYVRADIFKLEAILNNLISNAYKFSHPESVITIRLDVQDKENRLLRLQVEDGGVGIPRKDLALIFKRFYQSNQHRSINSEGSGIGLSLVRNFTELHDGRVEIASEENKGTTVTLYLPILDADLPDPVITGQKEKMNSHIKVLVVEDNVEIAQFIAENLQGADYRIAHNGEKGMEVALDYLPDVIIADIMMPVMNGLEMSRLLKENVNTATIPVIILTVKDDQYTEKEAFSMGVEIFISKPFDMDMLNMHIQRIFENKKHLINKLRQKSLIREKEIVAESQDEIFLSRITEIIEDKLDDPELNVQKLADLSGYSAKQIYRRIKLLIGNTAVDYIKSIRLKKAALLLSQKKFTVAEVMYMVGFSNHSYFSKCFSSRYGKTPKQYMDTGA
ncbi:MAG: response regulator [Tannerellaceae bacterium]|nr:response regulator [Tannerellaceae bacterium]